MSIFRRQRINVFVMGPGAIVPIKEGKFVDIPGVIVSCFSVVEAIKEIKESEEYPELNSIVALIDRKDVPYSEDAA